MRVGGEEGGVEGEEGRKAPMLGALGSSFFSSSRGLLLASSLSSSSGLFSSMGGEGGEGGTGSSLPLHPSSSASTRRYLYELKGVVAHVGTSDSGHYYSFIKEGDEDAGEDGGEGGRWFEYNDQVVSPFDPSLIPKECFGGTEPPPPVLSVVHATGGRGGALPGREGGRVRNNNAYLLFYQHKLVDVPHQQPEQHPPLHKLQHQHQNQHRQQKQSSRKREMTEMGMEGEEEEEGGEGEGEQTPLPSPVTASKQEQRERGVLWGMRKESEEEEEEEEKEEEDEGEKEGMLSAALVLGRRRRERLASERANSFGTYLEAYDSSSKVKGHSAGREGRGGGRGGGRGIGTGFPSALVRAAGGGGGRGERGRGVAPPLSHPSSSPAGTSLCLPLAVRRTVWEENMTFFQDKHRFDPHYARFVWQLLGALSSLPPSSSSSTAAAARLRAYGAGLRFVLEVLIHGRASSCLPLWFQTLHSLLLQPDEDGDEDEGRRDGGREGRVRRCGLWTLMYLADDPQGRKEGMQALLSCPHLPSRREVVRLVVAAAKEVVQGRGGGAAAAAGGDGGGGIRGLLELREGGRELAHPLARLVAWYLVVITHCAGTDGWLFSPPLTEAEEEAGRREGGPHTNVFASSSTGMRAGSISFNITPEVLLLLLELASLGPALRQLLRSLGGIGRLAALVASVNGGDNRHLLPNFPLLAQEVIALALRLLATLAEDASPNELHSPFHLSTLSSRRFVEMAATLHPQDTSLLLAKFVAMTAPSSSLDPSHLIIDQQQNVAAATAAVIRVLVDRALEATALVSQPPAPLPAFTSFPNPSPSYAMYMEHQRRLIALGPKPLLRVLQAVLGVAGEGGREGEEQQTWRLEQSLSLLDQCSRLMARGRGGVEGRGGGRGEYGGEMDLVWGVAKLYFSLAARSPVATKFVRTRVERVVREWRQMMGTMGGGGGRGGKR